MSPVSPPPPDDKAGRRQRVYILLTLAGMSLFMYVSFIIKTAVKGP